MLLSAGSGREGVLEDCPVRGVLSGAPSPLQMFAVSFRCFEFLGLPAGLFGRFSLDVALDGDDAVGAIGDPGVDVFHSLFEVGGGSGVEGIEGIYPASL